MPSFPKFDGLLLLFPMIGTQLLHKDKHLFLYIRLSYDATYSEMLYLLNRLKFRFKTWKTYLMLYHLHMCTQSHILLAFVYLDTQIYIRGISTLLHTC